MPAYVNAVDHVHTFIAINNQLVILQGTLIVLATTIP